MAAISYLALCNEVHEVEWSFSEFHMGEQKQRAFELDHGQTDCEQRKQVYLGGTFCGGSNGEIGSFTFVNFRKWTITPRVLAIVALW